jgi:recombinational DNA repair ATPase RecF
VKVRRLVVEGFRGIPRRVELPLPPEGACILAENGHGKTTFVDALDILTSGDLKYYHREGYGLDSVVNIDAPFARVTCETTTGEKFSRLIERTGVMPVLIENGRGASRTKVPPIPILQIYRSCRPE